MTIAPKNPDGSLMTVGQYFRRLNSRKAAKAEKRAALPWGRRTENPEEGNPNLWTRGRKVVSGGTTWVVKRRKPLKRVSDRQAKKNAIVTVLGLLDKKAHGPFCRLGRFCPRWRKVGAHHGEVAYHIIPQKRGDAARFVTENVVWACSDANFGEVNNRDLYRQHHVSLFGEDRVQRLEALARTSKKYSDRDLDDLLAAAKNLLTSA